MLRYAWGNLKFNKSQSTVKQPGAEGERQSTTQEEKSVTPSSSVHGETPEATGTKQAKTAREYKKYARYMARFFKAAWSFLTVHSGFVSAVATLAIAVLTFYYVKYAKRQWEAMNGQLVEMRKTTKAAQDSADLVRKQMEGISAAIVELRSGVPDVSFNPSGGQVRFSFTNIGHVIAHNVHVRFTATLHNVANPHSKRELISDEQIIPTLPPRFGECLLSGFDFQFSFH